jgi:predicted transcriptional regulator
MTAKVATKVRLTVDVTDELNRKLDELALATGGSKSDLLRKAITLIDLAVEAKRKGRHVAVVDNDDKVVTTIVGL